MQIIDTLAALERVADLTLLPILERYRDFMEWAVIYITEPGDTLSTLESARGWPFADFEFVHAEGGWFEVVFVICDDGFGHAGFVPDRAVIDHQLLCLCRANAVPTDSTP